jgi:tRNA(adenine34) deaminase
MTPTAPDLKDQQFMAEALAQARQAAADGEVPVGAVLVAADAVLAAAGNAPIRLNDPTAHAEIRVMRAAGEQLSNYRMPGSTLYVTLEPCPMCAAAMVHARIERLVFAASDPKSGAAGTVMNLVQDERLNHRLKLSSGVMEDQAANLLKAFFQERR